MIRVLVAIFLCLFLLVPLADIMTLAGGDQALQKLLWPVWLFWAAIALLAGLNMHAVVEKLELDTAHFQTADIVGSMVAGANVLICVISVFMAASS